VRLRLGLPCGHVTMWPTHVLHSSCKRIVLSISILDRKGFDDDRDRKSEVGGSMPMFVAPVLMLGVMDRMCISFEKSVT